MKKTMTLIFMIALGGMLCGQTITVTSPYGGEILECRTHHNISWVYDGFPVGTKVKLMLIHYGAPNQDPTLGSIVEDLAIGSGGSGTYDWTVRKFGCSAANGYKVRIRDMNNAYPYRESDPFSISGSDILPLSIKVRYELQPAVHSTGAVTIHKNLGCDLDSGQELSVPGCDDFRWLQNSDPPHLLRFIPCDDALFKTLGVGAKQSYAAVHNVKLQQIPIPDADLPLNMVVAYQTNHGCRGALRVTAKGADGSLTIAWTTYE